MAGASLLTLIDDIAYILDDVAAMTKIAAKKTAGVVGDDLALNAGQVSGVNPDRELPVIWKVAIGSFINKAILIPLALLISAIAPWAITPLLMIGGLFLCYEGCEKIIEKFLHKTHENHSENAIEKMALTKEEHDKIEKEKIKGAIKTDFILSAEIIVIALGAGADKSLLTQALTLIFIGVAMTVGVYGLVAGIVKADDAGLHLMEKDSVFLNKIGNALVVGMPKFMKFLSVIGTIAMFTVGGSILTHGIPAMHMVTEMLPADGVVHTVGAMLIDIIIGLLAGFIVVGIMHFKEPIVKMFKGEDKKS